MTRSRPLFRLAATALVGGTLSACALLQRDVPFETVPGPETPALLVGLPGRFAISEGRSICYPVRGLDPATPQECVSRQREVGEVDWDSAIVPGRPKSVLRLRLTIAAASAEAARLPQTLALGRVSPCAELVTNCTAEGSETFAAWSRPPVGNAYHQALSVSPDGRRAAVVPVVHLFKAADYDGRTPSDARFRAHRYVGDLKIVDLRTKVVRDAGIEVVEGEPISWSADGRRLLLVRVETPDRLSSTLAAEVRGHEGPTGQGVSVVETFDIETRATTQLAIGQQPLWSPDNRTLLYQPADDRLATMNLDDRTSRPVVLPGMSTRYEEVAIAFVAPRRVLYWALPTAGAPAAFTTNNSPLVGPKQLVSLKVADLDTGAFATVYAGLDPRARVGYRAD